MTEAGLHDRRFHPSAPSLKPRCRLCWRTVVLAPEHIEATELHVYVRCPHCGGSFPVRHSDIETFLGHETPAAG